MFVPIAEFMKTNKDELLQFLGPTSLESPNVSFLYKNFAM